VAELSVAVGKRLCFDDGQLEELRVAAELHDVGKLAVPDEVLRKPGPLDGDEWHFIRQHPVVGERILNSSPALQNVARIVRASHEHWDGRGYVDGLVGTQIPLAARIIAVCDAFCAMTAVRPYSRALSRARAIDELRRCAGGQFDPAVVEAVCRELATPSTPELSRKGN
jgi:HD-GYP domain-containing protein (c-di-GMP phosphodiesterase class II)